jgi:hypothetical protein
MRRLESAYSDCKYVEIDVLGYWKSDPDPSILDRAANFLAEAGVSDDASIKLVQLIEQSHRWQGRPRHLVMVELLNQCLLHDVLITTCGSLPPPNVDNGFYPLLEKCTNKRLLHVLVAPDEEELRRRLRLRETEIRAARAIATTNHWLEKPASKAARAIATTNHWLEERALYDMVLTGNEPATVLLEMLHDARTKANAQEANQPA